MDKQKLKEAAMSYGRAKFILGQNSVGVFEEFEKAEVISESAKAKLAALIDQLDTVEEGVGKLDKSAIEKHFKDWFWRLTQAYYIMCKVNLVASDREHWRNYFNDGKTIFEAIDADGAEQ